MDTDSRGVVDRFFATRTGVSIPDVKAGRVGVGTCDRRTYAERGLGFIRVLWIMHLGDRAAVSVHPAALAEVARLAWGRKPHEMIQDDFLSPACQALQHALPKAALDTGGTSVVQYHPGAAAAVATEGTIRAVTAADNDAWVGERRYMAAAEHPSAQCGEAFGLFLGDDLVADVHTHEPSVAEMAELVAQEGIEVAEGHRGRGYGKALLAAWTREMQAKGRVCVHSTSVDNEASVALGRSVGYIEYARTRGVTYHPPEGA